MKGLLNRQLEAQVQMFSNLGLEQSGKAPLHLCCRKGKLSCLASFPGPTQLYVACNTEKLGGAWEQGYSCLHRCLS